MSNFQLGLIIAGGLVLLLIIAYNSWVTRRNMPKRASPREGDVAQEPAVRQEPVFDGAGLGSATAAATEPHFEGHAVDAGDSLQLPVPPTERRGGLDPLIDVIAPIAAEQAVSGDAALAAMPPTRRAGSKPFAVEGYNEARQQWETPQPGQRYQQFQAG
ncbi:MAG: cell division protein FtsZ, partial [Proteobacteria bacterium]|nr:cell division protein FtsZ [Pseudomonadota bacterium]